MARALAIALLLSGCIPAQVQRRMTMTHCKTPPRSCMGGIPTGWHGMAGGREQVTYRRVIMGQMPSVCVFTLEQVECGGWHTILRDCE